MVSCILYKKPSVCLSAQRMDLIMELPICRSLDLFINHFLLGKHTGVERGVKSANIYIEKDGNEEEERK